MEEKIATSFLGLLSSNEAPALALAMLVLSMLFYLLVRERKVNQELVGKLLTAFTHNTATNEKLQAALDALKQALQFQPRE